jgi:hypothetical protein
MDAIILKGNFNEKQGTIITESSQWILFNEIARVINQYRYRKN